MKTLPYLKQLTYSAIIVAFPFIFSASRDTSLPEPVQNGSKSFNVSEEVAPTETIKTIRVTLDSLKSSTKKLSM